ncbi:60S ribosomal protein L8B [Podila horticola]|nr:60S ribosomal protein L8B [Podila horticola]
MKPTGDKNSNQAIEELKSGIRNSAESPCTPLPTPSAKASTSAAKPKNPDVPYSSTRQERMGRKNASNMPHPLSYTKRPDYRRLQHELKLHKVKHGYIQIAALTPQPPVMAQLKRYLERTQARTVFRFLSKYKTETAKQRIARKEAEASNAASEKKTVPLSEETDLDGRQDGDGEGDGTVIKEEVEGDDNKENKDQPDNNNNNINNNDKNQEEAAQGAQASMPYFLKHGIGHVAALVETQKALLVVVASDVESPEAVAWLPTLCRRKKVPYCIIREKMRLGTLVHKKVSPVVALTAVRQEHKASFAKVLEIAREALEEQLELEKDAKRALGNNNTNWDALLSKEVMMFKYSAALKKI